MSSLVGSTGIIGQDIVCGFGNGKYKTFEGTEIVAENCVKARVKDLVVEGKTIQDPEDLSNIESVTEKENNILSAKINDNTTTLNLPIPLRSLQNNVCDTIEGNKLVQRVGKVVLDENNANNFKRVNNLQVFRYEYFFDTTSFVSGICDKFPIKNVESLTNENIGIRLSGNNFKCIDIKFPDDTGFDIDTFKNWLGENPVTIYYELATPIIHDLEIPSISTTKGTNIITTTNNIKPNLKIKVKVKK